jgi:hypothetical protein
LLGHPGPVLLTVDGKETHTASLQATGFLVRPEPVT